jgi:uroporphyrinogen-III decarboxylase
MASAPAAVQAALEAITETTASHMRAALEAGADGIFFATPAINWHDRLTAPSLADARRRRRHGALVGGLGEGSTLRRGPVAAIAEQVRDAVRQAEGVGVIVGPGCVLPLDVPDAHLAAVVDTVATLT